MSVAIVTVADVNSPNASRPRLLVADLDNTVWDWFAAWHASFSAMLDHLIEISGVPAEVLDRRSEQCIRLAVPPSTRFCWMRCPPWWRPAGLCRRRSGT